MTNLFLRMKHWQLFLLMFVLVFVIQIVFMGSIMSNVASVAMRGGSEEEAMIMTFGTMRWMPLLIIVGIVPLFAYLWSVGTGLYAHLPKGVSMNLRIFKIFLGYAFFYLIFVAVLLMYVFNTLLNEMFYTLQTGMDPDIPPAFDIVQWVPFIVIMHLFAVFCIFYSLYFNSKLLKSIELGRRARFSDYIGYFFLNWFHIVGIWILQPKINKIHDGTFPKMNPEGNADEDNDILD